MGHALTSVAPPRVFDTPAALLHATGIQLGPTQWLQVDQARVYLFAQATEDHQWIHVDPVRAEAGPFGGAIAHGYLTLSLVNHFLPALVDVRGIAMGVNVGVNRLRFPAPLRVGKRIRATGELTAAEEARGGIQAVFSITVEIEGEAKPACVVETVSRYFPEEPA